MLKYIGKGLFFTFGSLGHALQFAYPEYAWDFSKFSLKGKKSSQRWLLVQLNHLLPPETNIIEDYYHPYLLWGKRNE